MHTPAPVEKMTESSWLAQAAHHSSLSLSLSGVKMQACK